MENIESADQPDKEAVKRVLASFLIRSHLDACPSLHDLADECELAGGLIHEAADGLESVLYAASLPFQLTSLSAQRRRFDSFHAAERIRGLIDVDHGQGLDTKQAEAAYLRAGAAMKDFASGPEGASYLRDKVVEELDWLLSGAEFARAARELLNQAIISTWAVFENFASSFVRQWINAHPTDARAVIAVPDIRQMLGTPKIGIEELFEHGLDMTQSMGNFLFDGRRLDNLFVLKSAIKAIFPSADISTHLGEDMQRLNQARHLLVHRRGIVDREYLSRTGDDFELGKPLPVNSEIVEKSFEVVSGAIASIGKASVSRA